MSRLVQDAEEAARVGAAARAAVRVRWSLPAMVRRHEELYDRVLRPRTRVAYVIDDLNVGGAQRQLLELVRRLPRDQFDVTVLVLSTERLVLLDQLQAGGATTVVTIPQRGTWSWSCAWRVYRWCRRHRPQVVHTWLFTADLYGRLAARLAGVPVVVSSVRSVEPWKRRHHVYVDRLLQRWTDAITVNAKAIAPVLQHREEVPVSKLRTIYNGIDVTRLAGQSSNGWVRTRWQLGSSPVVGTVGRLAKEKGHEMFLRAAQAIADALPEARFLVVGDGALRTELDGLARHLGLEGRVVFTGYQADTPALLSAMDVVTLASWYEGCSNVILEAMATAKPVVATEVGGNSELVVHEQTGFLVPPGDPRAFAVAVLTLLRDRDGARRMGAEGRRRVVEHFTVERMVQETVDLYTELLRAKARHGVA